MSSPFEAELENIVNEYDADRKRSKHDDCSDVISDVKVSQYISRCIAGVERVTGKDPVYFKQVMTIYNKKITESHSWSKLAELIGVVQSLLYNIKSGYLKSFEEIIHGEIFGDFLEMADYLNSNGYKDAAAVIAGSALEAHLRQLCKKSGTNTHSGEKPKKADTLNSELTGANAYSKLDQKNVTSWLGLRNDAAHGDYGAYTKEQVSLLIGSIRDFITRIPA